MITARGLASGNNEKELINIRCASLLQIVTASKNNQKNTHCVEEQNYNHNSKFHVMDFGSSEAFECRITTQLKELHRSWQGSDVKTSAVCKHSDPNLTTQFDSNMAKQQI